MGLEDSWSTVQPPTTVVVVPTEWEREEHWTHFDNSVNAVSFGFVATAILISMFLIMALFERFLRPRSSQFPSSSSGTAGRSGSHHHTDLEAPVLLHGKPAYPSPKMTVYSKGVSVLMPGDATPTFLAHPAPAPAPCHPEGRVQPFHQHSPCLSFFSASTSS